MATGLGLFAGQMRRAGLGLLDIEPSPFEIFMRTGRAAVDVGL